ncbi:MAG: hypothetical protein K6A64_01460 [Bacteroidales bacterium]|nr:hypothetical protein [Bacteroidales bacterium]
MKRLIVLIALISTTVSASVQPCKWFSINLCATRTALYGGVGINFMAFADR